MVQFIDTIEVAGDPFPAVAEQRDSRRGCRRESSPSESEGGERSGSQHDSPTVGASPGFR